MSISDRWGTDEASCPICKTGDIDWYFFAADCRGNPSSDGARCLSCQFHVSMFFWEKYKEGKTVQFPELGSLFWAYDDISQKAVPLLFVNVIQNNSTHGYVDYIMLFKEKLVTCPTSALYTSVDKCMEGYNSISIDNDLFFKEMNNVRF